MSSKLAGQAHELSLQNEARHLNLPVDGIYICKLDHWMVYDGIHI